MLTLNVWYSPTPLKHLSRSSSPETTKRKAEVGAGMEKLLGLRETDFHLHRLLALPSTKGLSTQTACLELRQVNHLTPLVQRKHTDSQEARPECYVFHLCQNSDAAVLPLSLLASGNRRLRGCPLEEKSLCCQETLFQISTLSNKLAIKTFPLPRDFYCLPGG